MLKSRSRWSLTLAVVLLAPWLLGATYKWVDKQGQVHFTDSPPVGTAYEVVTTAGSPSESPPVRAAPTPEPAAMEAASAAAADSPPPGVAETVGDSRDDARCVDALYQLEVLGGDWRVYKTGPGNERTYINDRDRPAEIERLSRERDANCSDEPDTLASQRQRARELFQALSPDCREAREKLQNLQRPTARSAPSDIENQQAYIASHCPNLSRDGVWLADWIWVWHR